MPKMKTRRSVAKRIRMTATGKIKRWKAGRSHLLSKKRAKKKMALRRGAYVSKFEREKIRKLVPY